MRQCRLRERVSDYGSVPVSFTAFDFLTEEERNLRHTLLLGMMLCIDEAAEARQQLPNVLPSAAPVVPPDFNRGDALWLCLLSSV